MQKVLQIYSSETCPRRPSPLSLVNIAYKLQDKRGAPGRGLKVVRAFTNSWWGGGFGGTNFQLLMLSSNLLKSKIFISSEEGGWGGWWNQFSTFDAEFTFAKIQNSYVRLGGGGVGGTNFQLLMLSSNLLKSKIPMSDWGGGGLVEPIFNFWCWVQIC